MSIPLHERQALARAIVARHPARQPVKRLEQQRLDTAHDTVDIMRERAQRILTALLDPHVADRAILGVALIGWGVLIGQITAELAGCIS